MTGTLNRSQKKQSLRELRAKPKVFVGMSGGVDSSVAALLLKKQGYDVVGVYIKSWDGLATSEGVKFREQCRWREDRRDAMRVAAKLKIPFLTYDFTNAYSERVIEYFFKEHEAGRTPNPDIICNKEIKFKLFLERAISEGADFIATGHYIRKSEIPACAEASAGRRNPKSEIIYELWQARDENKDQSYFLWTLRQNEIKNCLFPLGEYTKEEVRETARRASLPTAEKPDSQGICFVGEVPIADFLKARLKTRAGIVVTANGKRVGEHEGVAFYTIGQRHGLKLSSRLPYYVYDKDVEHNVIMVAEGNDDQALYRDEVIAENMSWINKPPQASNKLLARIRYRQKAEPLIVVAVTYESKKHSNILQNVRMLWRFKFNKPQRAITPGQSIVLYDGERMIGGGIIV